MTEEDTDLTKLSDGTRQRCTEEGRVKGAQSKSKGKSKGKGKDKH